MTYQGEEAMIETAADETAADVTAKSVQACGRCKQPVHYDPPEFQGGTGAGWQHVSDPAGCLSADPRLMRCPKCGEFAMVWDPTDAWADYFRCSCGHVHRVSLGIDPLFRLLLKGYRNQ